MDLGGKKKDSGAYSQFLLKKHDGEQNFSSQYFVSD